MALLKCPECGNEVSSKADFCPDCGYPVEEILAEQEKENQPTFGTETSPKVAPAWVKKIRRKSKILRFVLPAIPIAILLTFVTLAIIISPIFLSGMPALIPLCIIFLIFAIANPIDKTFELEGATILYHRGIGGLARVYIDGKLIGNIGNAGSFTYILPSGTEFVLSYGGRKNINFAYSPTGITKTKRRTARNTTIIHNYVNNVRKVDKNSQPKKSDVEKILLKHNREDVLASINPNDTEDAKKKIDLYNDLNDLGD